MRRLVILFLIGLCSCKKQPGTPTCYECEMTYASGISAAKQYPCTTNIKQWQKEQKDNNGDQMTSVCTKR